MATFHVDFYQGSWVMLKVVDIAKTKEELRKRISESLIETSEGNIAIYYHDKEGKIVDEGEYARKENPTAIFAQFDRED